MGKQKADYLLRSDHIFTSTVENPFAGYVAVSGQNILAVGTDDGSDWIDEQTEVLELGDQLVTPGFIDVHTFFTGYAIFHIGIDPQAGRHAWKECGREGVTTMKKRKNLPLYLDMDGIQTDSKRKVWKKS